MNDRELLQKYLRDGSEAPFAELVERHVGLVYSAALRIVRDAHAAEDVTQQVFALLARKAHQLGADAIVSAWLYRAARNIASETLRRDRRWRNREHIALAPMNESSAEATWLQIEPVLDEAMGDLSATDHDALVLRFFENKSLREIASVLGASEDAAQKRVARALDRLRAILARRGVLTTASVLAACVASSAVRSAPFGISAAAASMSIGSTSAPGPPVNSKLIAVTLATAVALLVVLLVVHKQNISLHQKPTQAATPAPAKTDAVPDTGELQRLRKEHLELLSLRGRVARLTRDLRETKTIGVKATREQITESEDAILFTASLTNRVADGHTLVAGGWTRDQLRGYLLLTPTIEATDTGRNITVRSKIVYAPEKFWDEIGWGEYKSDLRRSSLAGVLAPQHIDHLLQLLKATEGNNVTNDASSTVSDGGKASFGWSVDDDEAAETLMMIDVYPRIAADGKSIDVELKPTPIPDGLELRTPVTQTAAATGESSRSVP